MEIGTKQFFSTARERYNIMLLRAIGENPPWTIDPIFQEWRFCNVRREDDKTTVWFRNNIREHCGRTLQVVQACLIFRWFNRISTGNMIKDMLIAGEWNGDKAHEMLKDQHPLVTGAYMIKTVTGMNKLEGILDTIDEALPLLPDLVSRWGNSLEEAWKSLKTLPFMGPFMSYEVISDLRWTPVLFGAQDIMTWANPGPGCTRGVARVVYGEDFRGKLNRGSEIDRLYMLTVMKQLLLQSQLSQFWPSTWPAWEMREVEHWLCEFDKYKRVESGDNLKRRFRP